MRFIIDRFEGDFAIIQSVEGEVIEIPRKIVPQEGKEGDVLVISIDKDETEERELRIKEKFNRLLSK